MVLSKPKGSGLPFTPKRIGVPAFLFGSVSLEEYDPERPAAKFTYS
jgi:hypothetical protein